MLERARRLVRLPAMWLMAGAMVVVLEQLTSERLATIVTSYVLALGLSFGGLAVWPVYRLRQPSRVRRILWLKGIFVFHVLGALAAISYVAWAHVADIGDAYMTGLFVYAVGVLSLVMSAFVQLTGMLATLKSAAATRSNDPSP